MEKIWDLLQKIEQKNENLFLRSENLQLHRLLMPQKIQVAVNFIFRDFEHAAGGMAVAVLLGPVFFGVNFFVGFVVYYCVAAVGIPVNQIYGTGVKKTVQVHAEGPFCAVEAACFFCSIQVKALPA